MSQKKQSKEGTALLARFMHWRRMERGYTLKEASHLVGFAGHQSLQKIEKGERRIPLNKVPAIARVYAWDESDLHLLVLLGRLTDEKIDPNVLALHLPRLDAGGGKPTDDPGVLPGADISGGGPQGKHRTTRVHPVRLGGGLQPRRDRIDIAKLIGPLVAHTLPDPEDPEDPQE